MDTFLPGDRIEVVFTDDSARPVPAIVCSTLSDQQEGLGPEVEDYVAYWLVVSFSSCEETQEHRSISLGTDYRYRMDGRELIVRKLHSS